MPVDTRSADNSYVEVYWQGGPSGQKSSSFKKSAQLDKKDIVSIKIVGGTNSNFYDNTLNSNNNEVARNNIQEEQEQAFSDTFKQFKLDDSQDDGNTNAILNGSFGASDNTQ